MKKQTWLVTGTSTGFGRELATQLAQKENINLVATARHPEEQLNYLDQYDHGQILKVKLDVTKPEEVKKAVKSTLDRFNKINVLVNNAGIGYFGTFEESNLADAKYMFDVNVWGLVDMTRVVLPSMRENKSGIIINFSSIGGLYSFPTLAFYHGSKYAVEGITESIAKETADLGIKTMLVEPSGFRTDWAGRSSHKTIPTHDDYQQFAEFIDNNAKGAHHEPGDPKKAAEIIIDQVENNFDNLPTHLPLGKISSDLAIEKYTKFVENLKKERPIALSADQPESDDNND